MMYNLHTLSEIFLLLLEPMTSYHVTNIQKINLAPLFFSTLLCKEKESTKHLLVTSLIAQKSLRTHTNGKISKLLRRQIFPDKQKLREIQKN